MNKKLIATLLSAALFVVTALPVSAYAEELGTAKFFLKKIVINGAEINNYDLAYPFVLYGDTTYLPLTAEIGEICGFSAELDRANNIVRLKKKTPTAKQLINGQKKNDGENVQVLPMPDPVVLRMNDSVGTILDCVWLDMAGKAVIIKDDVPYLPLKCFVEDAGFGWSLYYDQYFGICVSTDPAVSASVWFIPEQAQYYKGLADHILQRNGNVRPSLAQDYVFLFKRAADVNAIEIELLMGMAQMESNFNAASKNRSGASGLMQIMPRTGAMLGLSEEQLLDARLNIFYGAAYFKQQLNRFDNNVGLAISAYAQGPSAVSRGAYSRGYIEKLIGVVGKIKQPTETAAASAAS